MNPRSPSTSTASRHEVALNGAQQAWTDSGDAQEAYVFDLSQEAALPFGVRKSSDSGISRGSDVRERGRPYAAGEKPDSATLPGSLAEKGRPRPPGNALYHGAAALRDHATLCRQCADVGRAGLPPASLCGAGWILFTAAMRARARRSS